MQRICIALILLGIASISCAITPAMTETIVPPPTSTLAPISTFTPTISPTPTVSQTPPYPSYPHRLGGYEIAERLEISPDDLTYDPASGHLFITATGDQEQPGYRQGIFELTLDGELVRQIPQPDCNGPIFGMTRIDQGPMAGHFLLVGLGSPSSYVCEYDADWQLINSFSISSPQADGHPGDAIVYNPERMAILVAEEVHGDFFEFTAAGEPMGMFTSMIAQGLTYNHETGTYLGVVIGAPKLFEMTVDGQILRSFDLRAYGVEQPVGITIAEGKLYIADELEGNIGGYIHIFELP